MYVYDKVWSNKFNRTLLFSSLMVAWSFFIEAYFYFWSNSISTKETLKHGFFSILYIQIFHAEVFGWLFHTIIWSIFFFFGWIVYASVKELSRSDAPNVTEFAIGAFVFAVFIAYLNDSVQIATLFIIACSIIWIYMYLSLKD